MRPTLQPVQSRRALEVIFTWLGSLFGGVLGMFVGFSLSRAYSYTLSSDGSLASLGLALVFTPAGGVVGVVGVVWALRRTVHAPEAGLTAIVCAILLIITVPLTAGVGSVLIPFNIGILIGAVLVAIIASLLSALLSYLFVNVVFAVLIGDRSRNPAAP